MSKTLKFKMTTVILALAILVGLSGCSSSSEGSVDPANVDATVTTDPAPAAVNQEVQLAVLFSGIELDKSATVSFEIRSGDKSEFVDASYQGNNTFSSPYSFTRTGINEVFIHLYSGDLHVTKKKPVEVQ
ncbi:hypothetical protein ACX1C1_14915 [Paenibacillus sp. strain BS8-2]